MKNLFGSKEACKAAIEAFRGYGVEFTRCKGPDGFYLKIQDASRKTMDLALKAAQKKDPNAHVK